MVDWPRRGEIFEADLPEGEGSEQQGQRPVVIVSNDIGNKFSSVVVAAAISSKPARLAQLWDVSLPANQGNDRLDSP